MQKPNTVLVAVRHSPCPPTASQWAAVRIKAYNRDIHNPLEVIPGAGAQERVFNVLTILTSKFLKFLSVIVLVLWLPDESGVSHGDGE